MCPSLGMRTMRTTEFVGRMAALPTRFDIRVMDDTHTPDVCVCAGGE